MQKIIGVVLIIVPLIIDAILWINGTNKVIQHLSSFTCVLMITISIIFGAILLAGEN